MALFTELQIALENQGKLEEKGPWAQKRGVEKKRETRGELLVRCHQRKEWCRG